MPCQYALGVLDKETQTLEIVKIESNKIFRLEPRFPGKDEVSVEANIEPPTAEKKNEGVKNVTKLFGTKMEKKKIKEKDNLNKKEDEETQKEMSKKIKELKTVAVALANDGSEPARNIPYHDVTAETPEKAYPLDKIISKGEWDILKNDLERKLAANGKLFSDDYPVFVCKRAEKLKEIEDETKRETLGVILLYMTHLIKFKDQQSIDHRGSAKSHSIPGMIFQNFRNKFMDEDGGVKKRRDVSSPKNDLLISHVLVLNLFVDGFDSDPTDLCQDLRIVKLTLKQHYEYLGCKMKCAPKGDSPHAIHFQFPSSFPH